MDIDLIFKIAAIGIIVSILNQVLSRSGREEQATMTTLAGLVVVLMMVAQKIAELFDLARNDDAREALSKLRGASLFLCAAPPLLNPLNPLNLLNPLTSFAGSQWDDTPRWRTPKFPF